MVQPSRRRTVRRGFKKCSLLKTRHLTIEKGAVERKPGSRPYSDFKHEKQNGIRDGSPKFWRFSVLLHTKIFCLKLYFEYCFFFKPITLISILNIYLFSF